MEISNPRRILAVSLPDSTQHLSNVVKDLTGNHPEPADGSTLAGTTHDLGLDTVYYKARVPIWLDLVAEPAEWAETFLAPEAREVLDVLGGVVVVFALPSNSSSSSSTPAPVPVPAAAAAAADAAEGSPAAPGQAPPPPPAAPGGAPTREQTRALISSVGRVVREGLGGWEWDGVGLGVGIGPAGTDEAVLDEWEDCCAEWGLEFVHHTGAAAAAATAGAPKGDKKEEDVRNEFGERTGISRVLEALEANDWTASGGGGGDEDEDDFFGDLEGDGGIASGARRPKSGTGADEDPEGADDADFDPESLDFGFDREDFAGLKKAIWSGGGLAGGDDEEDATLGDDDVQKLEGMMRKLQAVRDLSAGLPEDQRKKMAKKAVGEVMKEL